MEMLHLVLGCSRQSSNFAGMGTMCLCTGTIAMLHTPPQYMVYEDSTKRQHLLLSTRG